MKFYKNVDLSKIKVLSFDLDNTIYDCQSVLEKAQKWFTDYLCQRYGLGGKCLEYEFWSDVKSHCLHENMSLENDVTELRVVSLVKAFELLKMPLKGGIGEARELVNLFIEHRSLGIVADNVYNMLEKLGRKYPLVAVSNGNLDITRIRVEKYFDYDLRPQIDKFNRKPSSDLFHECASLKDVSPEEILHIGDDPYTDVMGAVFANCKTVWLHLGYTGISPDESHLRALPDIQIENILELENLLLK
ncbi:MAG: HAD-IA family hydrolase [Aeromonadales bacterium]|nr:HAD-IA family hydrolase [Aeromonadales bacterium]